MAHPGSIPGTTSYIPSLASLYLVAADEPQINAVLDLWGGLDSFIAGEPGLSKIEIEEELKRVIDDWTSRPDKAIDVNVTKVSEVVAKGFFMKLGFPLGDQHLENLRMTVPQGIGPEVRRVASIVEASRLYVDRQYAARTRVILRSYVKLLIQVMTSVNLTFVQDKVSHTIANPWIRHRKGCTANFQTTTTNIPKEMEIFLQHFRKNCGGDPTHIIVGNEFGQRIADNEFILDFLKYNPAFSALKSLSSSALKRDSFNETEVREIALYDEDGDSLWDNDKMLWIRDPSMTFAHASPRTMDAGFEPGLYTRQWITENPVTEHHAVGLGAVPMVIDPNRAAVYDIKTPD